MSGELRTDFAWHQRHEVRASACMPLFAFRFVFTTKDTKSTKGSDEEKSVMCPGLPFSGRPGHITVPLGATLDDLFRPIFKRLARDAEWMWIVIPQIDLDSSFEDVLAT